MKFYLSILFVLAFSTPSSGFANPGGASPLPHSTHLYSSSEIETTALTEETAVSSISTSMMQNNDIGLAMAGGSLRAASSCMGILRGLQQKRVVNDAGETIPAMDKVKYNSGISGGSIPAILYSYAQVPVDELLDTGRVIDPSKITREDLDEMPKSSMGFCLSEQSNQRWKIIKFGLSTKFNFFRLNSFWNAAVYKKFLSKYEVPKNKYIGPNEEELDAILAANKDLKKSHFLILRSDVKTIPLILFSMHGRIRDKNEYMNKYTDIMTEVWDQYHMQKIQPLVYPSMTTKHPEKRSLMSDVVLSVRDRIGGGNIPIPFVGSPEGVDTRYYGKVKFGEETAEFPLESKTPWDWGSEGSWLGKKAFGASRLSVEFLAGMSTNFPGSSGSGLPAEFTAKRKIGMNNCPDMTLRFADGGSNDLMGILPLVQRNVKNIISIYNFNQNPPYADFTTTYADIYKASSGCKDLKDPNFNYHFTEWLKLMNPRLTCLFGYFGIKKINVANILNHVFWDPDQDVLKELMVKFNTLYENGQPLIAELKDLEVIDNPFWGVKAEQTQKINLTLIYYNMPKKFSEQIPLEVSGGIDEDGMFLNPEFRSVPHLCPDGANALFYSRAQINLMGHLGSWMVDQAWDGLISKDGKVVFEGFGKIFK